MSWPLFAFIIACSICLTFATCPNGMIESLMNNNICYSFHPEKKAYLNAEDICRQQNNGYLTSVHSMFENVFVREQAQEEFTDSESSDFWFGATDLLTPGKWGWIDRSPFDFIDWEKGQPQNLTNYDCGAIKLQGGFWISDDCDKEKPYVCAIKLSDSGVSTIPPTTPKPKTCQNSWHYYSETGYCYKVVNISSNWDDGENWCFSNGGHLASIHSLDENIFVTNLIPFNPNNKCQLAWIGLYTVTKQESWRWTDNSPFNYSEWAPGRPGFPDRSFCGTLWNGPPCNAPIETWADDGCRTLRNFFICKTLPS